MRLPVSILTGFLGSGKTTLLNKAISHPAWANTAIIVNEFGEVGLDHDLVEKSDESVILLPNGCLCCAVKSDLVTALDRLYQMRLAGLIPRFDRVVIETSGLAEPTPVIEVILSEPTISARYFLDGITVTVDAVNGAATLNEHLESVKQVALANQIWLTKTQLSTPGELEKLSAELTAINPVAPVRDIRSIDGYGVLLACETDVEKAESYVGRVMEANAAHPAGHSHGQGRVRTFALIRDEPLPMRVVELFLSALAENMGLDLLRVKGLINVVERPDAPGLVQGAQRLLDGLSWLPAWPSEDRRTRIVFIVTAEKAADITDLLELVERMVRRN